MNAVSPIPVPSGLEPASGHAVAIGADASLSDVIETFRGNPELRLLAILDERRAPVGIIREQRVRELLFCPYWFSLMQNPTIGGSIDATYIGPNPAINAFQKSNGEAIRIVAGATSGGAYLVTKKDINATDDLRGKKIATPQLGNTQDVALRAWLKDEGLETTTSGSGDVEIVPQENPVSLETFRTRTPTGAPCSPSRT